MKKIVFTGGGTLGHVMPNIYINEELKDWESIYVGSDGIEKDKMSKIMKYHEIPAVKLTRGKVLKNLKIPFVLLSSIFKAKKILKSENPDVIFSKGGYVSLPVCIAGKMLKIPIIAHESDYSFGLANKLILKTCTKMCVNFKNLEEKSKKAIYTGPIFSEKFKSNRKDYSNLNIDKSKPTILLVGGSLGSKKINEMMYPILKDILVFANVIHITGKGNNQIKSYGNYNALEMSDDMVNLYNISDFVIGRSGAGVTAESFFKKLPMLLIPLENGTSRGDQLQNATYYEKLGVAKILREKDLNPTYFLKEIKNFNENLQDYKKIYEKNHILNGKDAVVELIEMYSK
ncbi:MAG: UDP-N-acetylglucosamine--N-acetylmuramyl-(pentapeptide) pyrophosphoryl-undecaprenol N-acetylglucosamine transferase [Clostridiales bacterium]|nr:UDP-N-acetylglucosamine--N-acetylmuramyl-(pentapeptide) pyrophosphoryl-undecaprenol N-acetylglucosamine transferase [Clostridiales bacterium]